jgi:hypothetical protein
VTRSFAVLVLVLVLVACGVPAMGHAQGLADYDYENLELRAIGLTLGGATPSRADNTLTIGLLADFGFLGPRLRIMPSLSFWASTLRQREVDRLASQIQEICTRQHGAACPAIDLGEIRVSDLSLNVDAHYVVPVPGVAEPYAGLGVGLHLLNGRGELIDDTFVEDFLDALSPGLNLFAGLGTGVLAPLTFYVEARYVVTPDIRYGALSLGGLWTLPVPVRAPTYHLPTPPVRP